MKQVVHFSGILKMLALGGLSADQVQSDEWIALGQGQINIDERVMVARGGYALVTVMKTNRHLSAEVPGARRIGGQPLAQSARDDRQEHVIDGGAARPRAPIRFISARGATLKANSRAAVMGWSKGEREAR